MLEKSMIFKIDTYLHERLKALAFEKRTSMASLIRKAILTLLENERNKN